MCNLCTNSIKLHTLSQIDPTGTTGLRNRFAAQMNKRFNAIARDITQAVDKDDCFGLKRRDDLSIFAAASPGKRAFEFKNDDEKVKLFMDWLRQQVDSKVLEISQGEPIGSKPWSNLYVQSAYQKGISDARNNLIKEGLDIPKFDGITETGQYIGAAFNKDFHVNRLGLLYTRTFNDLKGITDNMDSQISRVLAQGIADGRNPRDLARQLNKVVTGSGGTLEIKDTLGRFIPARRRAEMLARTEVIRSHFQAKLMEFKQAEVDGVIIKAEHLTAGDGRVCPQCKDLEGKTYTLEDESAIWNLIPVHTLCRCTVMPVIKIPKVKEKTIEEKEKFETKKDIMPVSKNMDACVLKSFVKNAIIINDLDKCKDYYRDGKTWKYNAQGEVKDEAALTRLNGMKLPPAWQNVVVAQDETAKVQAIGQDKAGRWQYRYSAAHMEAAAMKKFNRNKLFSRDIDKIRKGYEEGIKNEDPRAYLLRLEDQTAIRVGSDKDFKAKAKAYGLTTLEGRHVKIEGDKIILDFTAKEGLPAHYEVKDKVLASWLKKRAETFPGEQQLFPDVNASQLNKYIKEVSGANYTAKDFRTYHGTRVAYEELQKYKGKVLTAKEKKKIIDEVSKKASEFLHNTPVMARGSYINPIVWDIIGGL